MSGLVYRGDTIDNFGELLPCPYIEKVWVQEKGWVVQLSLMINTLSADPDIDLIENNLRALTYYTCPVWDEPSHRILNNYKNDDIFRLLPILEKEAMPVPINNSVLNDEFTFTSRTYRFEDFQKLPGPFWDDSGNLILKYTVPYDESEIFSDSYTGVPATGADWDDSSSVSETDDGRLAVVSKKFGPFRQALPSLEQNLKNDGFRYDSFKLIAWSSPIYINAVELAAPTSYGEDSTVPGSVIYRKYNADTGVIDELPVSRTKPAHYVQFPTRCGFSPEMISGDMRIPTGVSRVDLYGTTGGGLSERMESSRDADFYDISGTRIAESGDLLDRGGAVYTDVFGAVTTSLAARRASLRQLVAFQEDTVLGYMPLELDDYVTEMMEDYTATYDSKNNMGEKCIEQFSDFYNELTPIYDYDPDNYKDEKLHLITDLSAVLGTQSTKASKVRVAPAIIKKAYTFDNLPPVLVNQFISDIAVEDVFVNGNITTSEHQVYVREDGSICSAQPIQSLDGNLYAPDDVSLTNIVDDIKALVDSYEEAAKKDRDLAEIIAQTSTLLQTYGADQSFLPHMNRLRHTWPDKSTSTRVGRLYERLKRRLYNANVTVRNQGAKSKLSRRFVANNKVVNSVGADFTDIGYLSTITTPGNTGYIADNPYIFNKTGRTTAENFPEVLMTRAWVEGSGTVDNFIRASGYWFFDFEKALRNESAIAQVLNIDKLYKYFGRQLVHAQFKFKKVRMDRRFINEGFFSEDTMTTVDQRDDSKLLKRFNLKFDTGTSVETPTVDELVQTTNNASGYSDTGYESVRIMKQVGVDGTPYEASDLSYLTLRALGGPVSAAGAIADNLYRIAAFEFQDYYNMESLVFQPDPDFSDVREFYRIEVTINDETMEVYNSVRYQMKETKDDLWNYLQAAREACSYNNWEFVFNDFFSNGMDALYAGNPQSAPWIRAPLVYEIQRDLLGNSHAGDVDRLMATAKKHANNINPYNGNLPDLEAFWLDFRTLWGEMYDAPNFNGTETAPTEGGAWIGSIFDTDNDAIEAGGFSTDKPKDIQARYGRNRDLVFGTDISELPKIENMDFDPDGTGIDDILGWVRMDLAEYFELIHREAGIFDGVTGFTDWSVLKAGDLMPGIIWRAAGAAEQTFAPAGSSETVWQYLGKLQISDVPDYVLRNLIRASGTGNDIRTSAGYDNYCLGDLWVMSIISLAELGMNVDDAVQLVVYDYPSLAELETYRERDGTDDGYIYEDTGGERRVIGLAPVWQSYKWSLIDEAYGGILDRASDGGAKLLRALNSPEQMVRGKAILNMAKLYNMSQNYMVNDDSTLMDVDARIAEAGTTGGGGYVASSVYDRIQEQTGQDIQIISVSPADADSAVAIDGKYYQFSQRSWWDWRDRIQATYDNTSGTAEAEGLLMSRLIGRTPAQVAYYAAAIRHIYANYSFGGGFSDAGSRNRLIITNTRGGTPATAAELGLEVEGFRGMESLVYATNALAGSVFDETYESEGAEVTSADVVYQGLSQFDGVSYLELIAQTGGEYDPTTGS